MTTTGDTPASRPTGGQTPLPTAPQVRDLLERLLGRDVEVSFGGPLLDPAAPGDTQVSTYVDRSGAVRAVLAADLPLAARAGAAIGLAPAAAADAAVQDGELPALLFENMREVLNVTASLLNVDGAPHVAPGASFAPGALLPPDLARLVRAYVRRLDLDVAVKGYGSGRLSVIVP